MSIEFHRRMLADRIRHEAFRAALRRAIEPGRSTVADIGAGSGWFTVRLARRVGPQGLVYAQDVQQEMLNAISRRVQREGLNNVRPVLGRGPDPHLPPARLDAALIVDAFHEIEDRVTMLTNIARALKPQGRIGVVDFRPEGSGPGPDPEERVRPEAVVQDAEIAQAGASALAGV